MHLVTGGGGFIGSHLVERLLRAGSPVRVLDNFSTGSRQRLDHMLCDIDLHEADVRDEAAVGRACAGVDVVYHLAAEPSVARSVAEPQRTLDINVSGTLNLLQAAQTAGCQRLVFSSTCAVYGDRGDQALTESALPQPLSPYAVSKLTGEHLCAVQTHVHGLETVSLRYFNVYGPGQDPASAYAAAIPKFAARLRAGEAPIVFGDGEQTRDFVFVGDVVSANILAATSEGIAGEVFNIGSGQVTTINQVVTKLQNLLGTQLPIDYEPPRLGEIRHSLGDIGKARTVLQYAPLVSFDTGLARLIDDDGPGSGRSSDTLDAPAVVM